MKAILRLCDPVILFGAINWGLVGAFDYNLVDEIFSGNVEKIIYVVIGLAGLFKVLGLVKK